MTDTITLPREVVQEWHDRIKASSNFNDRESLKMYDLRQEIAAALAAPKASDCTTTLRMLGKPYGRSCKVCGLGPCKYPLVANPAWPTKPISKEI